MGAFVEKEKGKFAARMYVEGKRGRGRVREISEERVARGRIFLLVCIVKAHSLHPPVPETWILKVDA